MAVLIVGAVATNVVGKRLLQQTEGLLLRVPLFRSIYAPVKQLVVAFSPDNEHGFKRVVLIEDASRGLRAWIPDQGVHHRPWSGPGGVYRGRMRRPTSLPWRHRDLPSRSGGVSHITVEQGIRVF